MKKDIRLLKLEDESMAITGTKKIEIKIKMVLPKDSDGISGSIVEIFRKESADVHSHCLAHINPGVRYR